MTPSQFETAQLALIVWREAESEQINGQIAVAKVLKNRALAGWHRGDLLKNLIVISQNKPPVWHAKWPDAVNEPGFQQLLQTIDSIDSLPDMTDGALYYVRTGVDQSDVADLTRTSQVGGFQFFR